MIAQETLPCSGIGLSTNIPRGEVVYFLIWRQTLEQDCRVL